MTAELFDFAELVALDRPLSIPRKSSMMTLRKCEPAEARRCVAAWHSRLPMTQRGPWMLAFVATFDGQPFGGALWNNPSARTLPADWLELRRLAMPDYAPPHAASWMLGAMRKWIRVNLPGVPRLISYQDMDVHTGTIYRAAGWEVGYVAKPRIRDRSAARAGTTRAYRSNLNGANPDAAGKARWEVTP